MSSTILSTEKSAGGEIVSNLCHFQGKQSQPHSLLGRGAGGRGYSAPTLRSWGKAGPSWWLWEWRAAPPPTASLFIPVSPTGIFLLLHEQTQPLSQEDDGQCERFRGWHEEVAWTASQSIPAGGDCQMLLPPQNPMDFQHGNGAEESKEHCSAVSPEDISKIPLPVKVLGLLLLF